MATSQQKAAATGSSTVREAFGRCRDMGEKLDLAIFAIAELGNASVGKAMHDYLDSGQGFERDRDGVAHRREDVDEDLVEPGTADALNVEGVEIEEQVEPEKEKAKA
jgi:hypothetical protein